MRILTSRAELRAALGDTQPGLVPTMGALHEGHLALIRRAVSEQPVTVVSIFVNPAQFNDPADLAKYPRDLDRDLALIEAAGADLVFAPPVTGIYPPGFAASVEISGLSERWEGAARPGHFRGVATVVTILLNLVHPARAYFGEKDYQQLLIIRRLARDLALPGEIIGCPTVRDADGLALSSRNVRLAPELRLQAGLIPCALTGMAQAAAAGETDCARLLTAGQNILATGPELRIDYLAIVDPADLTPLATLTAPARIITAVYAGNIRLIDNLALSSPPSDRALGCHEPNEQPVIPSGPGTSTTPKPRKDVSFRAAAGVPLGHLSFPNPNHDEGNQLVVGANGDKRFLAAARNDRKQTRRDSNRELHNHSQPVQSAETD